MKRKLGHTSTKKGKRVILFFQNGEKLLAKFLEKKSGRIITDQGTFSTQEVYKLAIYRSND